MPPNLMDHDQIIQEVLAGTGATFVAATAHNGPEAERNSRPWPEVFGGASSDDASKLKPLWLSLAICGVAGGAVIIAILALIVACRSIEQGDLLREGMRSIDAKAYDVANVMKEVQAIAAEQTLMQEASAVQSKTLQTVGEKIGQFEVELRQSLDGVDQKINQVVGDYKEREAFLGLRLDGIYALKTTRAAASDDLGLRGERARSDAALGQEPQGSAMFRLTRIDRDVATIEGPSGPLLVSVGEDVPGLGKVMKIGKQGRNGIVVATHKTLKAPWEQVVAAESLRLDIEHDFIDVPTMTEPPPTRSADRRKKWLRRLPAKAF